MLTELLALSITPTYVLGVDWIGDQAVGLRWKLVAGILPTCYAIRFVFMARVPLLRNDAP